MIKLDIQVKLKKTKKKKYYYYSHAIKVRICQLIIELREVNSHESLINFIFESVVIIIF
jgi:hypothetical protein